jgi:hypothetical protein
MKNYKCEICGKKHNVYYGIKAPMAKKLRELSEDEKATRLVELDGIFLLDRKRAFFPAKIFIPNGNNGATLLDLFNGIIKWLRAANFILCSVKNPR